MPQYIYKAKQGPQNIVEGMVDADTLEAAINKIVQLGLAPVDIKKKSEKAKTRVPSFFHAVSFLSQKIPASEKTFFMRQLSDLLDAGIPVLQVLHLISRQTRQPRLKETVEKMYLLVKDGSSLSAAFREFPHIFPAIYSHMIAAGELSGNLNEVVSRLADFLEKDTETRSRIQAALFYPALIIIVGTITIFVLLTWVIPRITVIFEDLNQTLPLITQILLGLSSFFAHFGWLVICMVGVAVMYAKRIGATPQGKWWLDQIKLNIPFWGNFIRDAQIGRFARMLGTLLGSGVVIVTALESVSRVIENEVLKRSVVSFSQRVVDGDSLTQAVKEDELFPDMVVNMIAVGEQSGQLPLSLFKLANYYEGLSQRFMKNVTSLIEPFLILVMGLVIAFVVFAMVLPIFQMNLIIQ